MDEPLRNEMRNYAWKYYALHAEQRIKTFNFFLIMYALAVGGLTAAVKDLQNRSIAAVIAFLMAFVSFIFWKLDLRNKQLIKHAEAALMELENDFQLEDQAGRPHRLKLFQREEIDTNKRKEIRVLGMPAHFSFSTCFNIVFATFGGLGFVVGVVLLLH